uniref:Uncharacterized protein n=1 Tax=Tanacetum cinerariifolium TaxID=118510 RepID=A0A6L2N9Q4_TANCI|nr:hypothetical protein [Tanacetum cinerariifolium]
MERFKKAIFKQREEINDRMAEMFGLLKELTVSRTLEKVLVREEARHHITKNVNAISLVKMKNEKNIENEEVVDKNVIELSKLNAIEPKEITGDQIEELVELPMSQLVGYYLTHEINKKLIEGLTGIANDILVELDGYVYPVDFMILDIKEDEKKPFILGTVEEETKSDIGPVAPTNIVSRLILEWEKRIKLHREKVMEFNQWRSKVFNDGRYVLVNEGCGVIFDEEKPGSSKEFHVEDFWMMI